MSKNYSKTFLCRSITGLFIFIISSLLINSPAFAQTNQESPLPALSYTAPANYEIGGITTSGTRHLDPDIVISLSGLSVGQNITLPGEEIGRAINRLWEQGLFTDIEIQVSRIVDRRIFLDISIQERPRLSRFSFRGVRKAEADDLRSKVNLIRGRVVTENTKMNARNAIENYFFQKGFLNVSIDVDESPDTLLSNSVQLIFNIDKGSRVRVNRVYINGNENLSDMKIRGSMRNTNERVRFSPKELLGLEKTESDTVVRFRPWRILGNLSLFEAYEYVADRTSLNIFTSARFIQEDYEIDKRSIVRTYNELGYRDARIVSDSVYRTPDGHVNVKLNIDEGPKYYFRNIAWRGNLKYSQSQLDEILNIKKGDVYNQSILEKRLFMDPMGNDISSLYMDDGYLFFQVTPVEVAVTNDSIDIEIRIYEGAQATINEVRILGNTKTNEHVIRRELRTLPGSKFSRSDIIRSQREIANLGFFDPERIEIIPIPDPQRGLVDLEYRVVEKPSDQLELSAGWGGRGRGVVGTLGVAFTNFSLRNITRPEAWQPLPSGDGQRLTLRVQTNGRFYQSYNLSFTEPWLGGNKPNQFTFNVYRSRFADIDRDLNEVVGSLVTNAVSVGLGNRLNWPDDFFVFQPTLSFQNYTLNNWRSSNFLFTDGYSNNLSLKLALSRNSIDQPIFPRRGSSITASVQFTPYYSAFSDKDYAAMEPAEKFKWLEYHKWRFKADWYTPIVGNLVLKTSANFGFLGYYNQDLGYSPFERFEVGGDGISNFTFFGRDIISLRGYDVLTPPEAAPIFNKFTMELRYPLTLNPSSTIYVLAFAEGGNFYESFDSYNPFQLNRSAGLGLRVFLPMFGLLGFDYGIGFDNQFGAADGFGDYLSRYGKFNIILGFEPE
ncbi:MAG: outer membrane protein assembly factor BamA [Chitinophagaceae bacterium]|nr:MAG: outer membrane protein assembly factor BamA [Chitinophagaceae bacterium]